jgi:hypothetical protein
VRAFWAALAATVIVWATGCGVLLGPGPGVVTPAQATQVVRDYWRVNERAAMSHDADLFGSVQTGLLQEADTAIDKAAHALGAPGLAAPRPLRRVTVYVPRQRGYPAEFLALIETVGTNDQGQPTKDPIAFYDHFSRATAGAKWLADFASDVDPQRPLKFALDGDGYASTVPANAGGYALKPEAVGDALIGYYSSGVESGTPQGPFDIGKYSSGSVVSQRQYRDIVAQAGNLVSIDYTTRPFERAYRGAAGSAIVLFAVQATASVTTSDPNHRCLLQPPDLRAWGGLVPAGSYSSLGIDDLLEMIAADPPARPGAKLTLLAQDDTRVGVRAAPFTQGRCG